MSDRLLPPTGAGERLSAGQLHQAPVVLLPRGHVRSRHRDLRQHHPLRPDDPLLPPLPGPAGGHQTGDPHRARVCPSLTEPLPAPAPGHHPGGAETEAGHPPGHPSRGALSCPGRGLGPAPRHHGHAAPLGRQQGPRHLVTPGHLPPPEVPPGGRAEGQHTSLPGSTLSEITGDKSPPY